MVTTEEHPFAEYVRILGKGPKMFRDLEEPEACAAMGMVLRGAVMPEQLGAFLLLLRRKGETAGELAGFVRAAREHFGRPAEAPAVDIDWPSYADRHRQQPWFLLAALLLAENGLKVLVHGIEGYAEGYAPTPEALARLGIRPSASLDEAAGALRDGNFAYLPLRNFCPALDRLFDLRPILGVRTVVNTFARDLNPLGAPCQLQGVFHPPYRQTHQETALRLGQPRAAIFKGGGGEVQRTPLKPCIVATVNDGVAGEEEWPAAAAKDAVTVTVLLAFCWSHGRRKFFEIHKATRSPVAGEVLRRIAELYRIEDEVRGRPPDVRRAVRQEKSRPKVEALKTWLEEQLARASGKMPVATAIRYLLTHWDGLCVFLDDGRVEMDTNTIERQHRVVATSRKNALFAGSDAGARSWAILTSLIQTASLNGLDPFSYLKDVLERIVSGQVKTTALDTLLPWTWKTMYGPGTESAAQV